MSMDLSHLRSVFYSATVMGRHMHAVVPNPIIRQQTSAIFPSAITGSEWFIGKPHSWVGVTDYKLILKLIVVSPSWICSLCGLTGTWRKTQLILLQRIWQLNLY